MDDYILKINRITKFYSDGPALKDVSFNIPRQSIFGLLGPNGAGKTTLLRIITKIIEPDQGALYFENEILNPRHINSMGYLPEERGLYKKMRVGEQLIYLAQLKGLTKDQAKARIQVWDKRFEMKGWWNRKIEDLSKGMQQKVQFISTVIHQPDLIILDEPFSGFDPVNQNLIKENIFELRERGCTVILSTHRMESVDELCDYIVLIHKAEKLLEGSTEQVKQKYRSNTFKITHFGALPFLNGQAKILNQKKIGCEHFTTEIRLADDVSPNALLRILIDTVEIREIQEKIPSISDVFLKTIKNG